MDAHKRYSRNVSPASDQTIAYINSGDDDTEFDSLDEEPLAKYMTKIEPHSSKEGNKNSDGEVPRGRGRPRGKVQPKKNDSTLQGSIECKEMLDMTEWMKSVPDWV